MLTTEYTDLRVAQEQSSISRNPLRSRGFSRSGFRARLPRMAGDRPIIRVRTCPLCGLAHVWVDAWVVCHSSRAVHCEAPRQTVRRVRTTALVIAETLLLRRGRITSIDELADVIWPMGVEEPDNYASAVAIYVHYVRKFLQVRTNHGRGYEVG